MNKREQVFCEQIYEQNKLKIRRYLARHFSWIEQEDVRDVMQDVWKALSENIQVVGEMDTDHQWAWLVTVAYHNVVSLIRRDSRKKNLKEKIRTTKKKYVDGNPVQQIAVNKMIAKEILDKLSPSEREVLFGAYLKHPFSDVIHQESNNAMTCKKYRARLKLKKLMEERGLDE